MHRGCTSPLTICSLSIHWILSSSHCLFSLFTLLSTVYSLSTHCLSTVYSLSIYLYWPVFHFFSLPPRWIGSTGRCLIHSIVALSTHFLFNLCSFSMHSLIGHWVFARNHLQCNEPHNWHRCTSRPGGFTLLHRFSIQPHSSAIHPLCIFYQPSIDNDE